MEFTKMQDKWVLLFQQEGFQVNVPFQFDGLMQYFISGEATNGPVLKHQALSIHSVDKIFNVLG